ncbi:MAG: hypothetical protein H8D47_01000 [Planctomycetes bacterium]|nr:hypothetical protein [Planctomycetota bacterium]
MVKLSGITKSEVLVGLLVAVSVGIGVVALVLFDTTGGKGSGLDKDFIYDIGDKVKIDPNLIFYTESSVPIVTGFKKSHAIAIDANGTIYAAGDKAVRLFESSGNSLGEIQLDSNPRCITVSKDGNIYIGMKNHVLVYDANKKHLASWPHLNSDAVLTSIAVLKNDIFVADAGNRIVLRYDTNGKLLSRIGGKDNDRNIPGFVIPSPYFDLAIADDGLLRVVNPGRHRIEAYTFDGDLEFWWGIYSPNIEGFCGCCNPVNFAILEDGSFVTAEKGLVRVKVYDIDGNFTAVVAGPEQLVKSHEAEICQIPANCQAGGFDLAVDNKQQILILDTIKNVIRTFAKTR